MLKIASGEIDKALENYMLSISNTWLLIDMTDWNLLRNPYCSSKVVNEDFRGHPNGSLLIRLERHLLN